MSTPSSIFGRYIKICVLLVFSIIIVSLAVMEEDKLNASLRDVPVAPSDWWEMDDRDWWDNTPEGQNASSRLMSGELSIQDMEFIFKKMGEGKTYYEARKRVGIFLPKLRCLADELAQLYYHFLELG